MTGKKPELKPKPKPLYKSVMWSGVKKIYQCATCGHCEDTEKAMRKHVLLHKKEG